MQEYRLENGLHVICEKGNSGIGRAMLNMNIGSVHEIIPGTAHFLEHIMMIGGTEKYSSEEQREIFDSLHEGNAFTDYDRTSMHAEFLAEDLNKFVDFAIQSMFYPRFGKIKQERTRVLRECADRTSKYSRVFDNYIKQVVKGPWTRDIAGTVDSVKSITEQDLRDFHSLYGGVNAQLYLSGVDASSLEIDIPRGKKIEIVKPSLTPVIYIRQFKDSGFINKDNPEESLAKIYLNFFLGKYDIPSQLKANFLANELGIRLYEELSEKKGLCYSIIADNNKLAYYNTMKVSAKVLASSLEEAVDTIFDVFQATKKKINNFDRLTKDFKIGFLKRLESPSAILNNMYTTIHENFEFEKIISLIDNMKEKDILDVAQMLPSRDGLYYFLTKHPFEGEEL